MKITTNHSASSYGLPVILDGEGRLMDYPAGLAATLARLGWSRRDLADRTGFKPRTVEGWFVGRPIPAEALNVLSDALKNRADAP